MRFGLRQVRKLGRWLSLVGLSVVLASCAPTAASDGGPAAWIDKPLEGSSFPVGEVLVMAHAAAPEGLAGVELRVGEERVALSSPEDPAASLVTLSWEWRAEEPGAYLLQVRAQNHQGTWGEFDQSLITIIGQDTPIASPTPTQSPTGTTSATATLTPSATSTATVTAAPGSIGVPTLSNQEVRYDGSCTPAQVSWQVAAQHPSGVGSVFLFHRLQDVDSGQSTGWSQGRAMTHSGGGTYQLTLTGDQLALAVGYQGQAARVQYQIVLQPLQGENLRSSVYDNLSLKKCGIIIIIPPPFPTATGTPVVK